jgi:hypothetical protein
MILTAGDADAQVWDARTLRPIGPPIQFADGVRFARFDAPASRILVLRTATRYARPGWETTSGEAAVFDAATGRLLRGDVRHGDRPPADADLSPDGSLVATCSNADDTVLGRGVGEAGRVGSRARRRQVATSHRVLVSYTVVSSVRPDGSNRTATKGA